MKSKPKVGNPQVDVFLEKAKAWREESELLRKIIRGFPLTEELKWGKPCYTFQESNILIIQGFKEYCALMFCKGALLTDEKGVLIKPGQSTQAGRQMRFTNAREIAARKSLLKAYIQEAIEAEKAGRKVVFKTNPEPVPEELQARLAKDAAFKKAFESLTPGRQRGYILHISAAKQSATRESRIDKCTPLILAGRGFNDR